MNKRLYCFIIIFLMFFLSLAGKSKLEDKQNLLDPEIKTVIDKAFANIESKETGEEYLLQALKISKENFPSQTGKVYSEMARFFIKTNQHKKSINYLKKALDFYKKLDNKKKMSDFYKKLGEEYLDQSKYKEAENNFREFGKLCELLENKLGFVDYLNNIGEIYIHFYKYKDSETYLLRSIKLAKKSNYKEAISIALNSLGILYRKIGKISKTLECYFKSIKIDEEIKNTTGLSRTYNNIANIYISRKDYKKAMSYIEKGILMDKKSNRKRYLCQKYNTKALIYAYQNKISKGLPFFKKALKLSLEIKFYEGASKYYANIALSYRMSNNLSKAMLYYKKSFELAKQTNNIESQIIFYKNTGYIYLIQKKYKKAELNYNKALKMSKTVKTLYLIRDTYNSLTELAEAKNNYKEALDYYKKHIEVKDKILNKASNDKIAEMQTKYDTEKKEKEITLLSKNNILLEKDNQIKKLEIVQQGFKTKFFIIGFVLVFVILILLFFRYKKLFAFWKKKSHIGPYRLLDRIGSGGMAVVFKGFHVKDKSKEIAIKILKEDIDTDINQKERFFNEAKILKDIQHENIIKIFEVGELNNQLFIAMEYIKGDTLSHYIDNNTDLFIKNKIMIMRQIINSIVELHKKEIIHRDLKPDNIMLYEDGEQLNVKLLDFGLAKTQSLNSLTKTGMILGTIYYMPPEQLFHSVFSFAGDIYSLGIIFYEMITGQKPFKGDTTGEIMFEILNKDPNPILKKPDLPEAINTIIFNMINKEPQNRPDIISIRNLFKQF